MFLPPYIALLYPYVAKGRLKYNAELRPAINSKREPYWLDPVHFLSLSDLHNRNHPYHFHIYPYYTLTSLQAEAELEMNHDDENNTQIHEVKIIKSNARYQARIA